MRHDEGTFRGVGGLELYYQRWRPATEPPRAVLAIVHGFGEHSGRYINVVNHLVPRGYAVYGFDHRGHGRSPGRRGYIKRWTEFRGDVRALVDMIKQREPERDIFLLGHSLGGLIVLEYALHYPEGLAGVIASAPALGEVYVPAHLFLLSRILSRIWPGFSRSTGSDGSALSRDPAVVQAVREDLLRHNRGTARLGTEFTAAIRWTQAHAADLQIPLLILHGTADRVTAPEGSRIFFERVTFGDKARYEYEGGYHEPHNDIDAERVLTDVERWLEQHSHGHMDNEMLTSEVMPE